MKWYLIVALTTISLMTSIFSYSYWLFVYSPKEMSIQIPWLFLTVYLFFFFLLFYIF